MATILKLPSRAHYRDQVLTMYILSKAFSAWHSRFKFAAY